MMSRAIVQALFVAIAAVGSMAMTAEAHVTMSPADAPAGSDYVGVFRVSHGCKGSATIMLSVTIPAGVGGVKPQPKAGWTVQIDREPPPDQSPDKGGHGGRVSVVTWRGRLPDDEFDTFGLSAKLPEALGAVYFPVVQACESGEERWTDIPAHGQAWRSVAHPAPLLVVTDHGAADKSMPGMDMH